MKTYRHITTAADNNVRRARGSVVSTWNESSTIELTMTVREIKELEKRFFIDVDEIITDELMGKLLHHFRDEGTLLDEESVRI